MWLLYIKTYIYNHLVIWENYCVCVWRRWKLQLSVLSLTYFILVFTVGFFEMKMKYDESDNAFIRASRAVTDKMTDLIGEELLVWQSTLITL